MKISVPSKVVVPEEYKFVFIPVDCTCRRYGTSGLFPNRGIMSEKLSGVNPRWNKTDSDSTAVSS